jgi:hypothetical protein
MTERLPWTQETLCTQCGEPVDPSAPTTFRHVTFIEVVTDDGGAEEVPRTRIPTGEWVHARCIARRRWTENRPDQP